MLRGSCLLISIWFHEGLVFLLSFISFLIWDWKFLVGSFVAVWELLACMKSCILESYCLMGKITKEFPLSVCVIMASLFLSLVFMVLIVLASGCALYLGWELLFSCRVFMCSAVIFLYTSWSEGLSSDIAVSACKAGFVSNFHSWCANCTLRRTKIHRSEIF